jgi:hypothetical protein
MDILNLIALILATDAVVTAWFYGSIFAKPLAYFEKRGGFWGELFMCPLCLSFHIAFWLMMLFLVPGYFLPTPWNILVSLPLYSLAATDVVHWLHGIRPIKEIEEEDDDEDDAGAGDGFAR